MRETVNHLCELIRDVFHIKRQPITVKVERTDTKKLDSRILIGWCLFIFLIFNLIISNNKIDMLLSIKKTTPILTEVKKREIGHTANRLSIDNLTIISLDEETENGLVEVVWTKDVNKLYNKHSLTMGQKYVMEPLIYSFMSEGLCYNNNGLDIYCPFEGLYIVLIDIKEEMSQDKLLFTYKSIKSIIYDN